MNPRELPCINSFHIHFVINSTDLCICYVYACNDIEAKYHFELDCPVYFRNCPSLCNVSNDQI